ncbi:MAG: mycobactin polyketide synthase MbtD [Mycobacterium sp.]|nr:mycobactin polyketide synthase MbtD [Mycobacterium sp.]
MPAHALPDHRVPVLLSAHEQDLIGQDAAAIAGYLRRNPETPVTAVAGTVLRTRRVRRHRAVVRAADRAELTAALAALADGDEHPLVARSSETAAPRIAFVFPGQGSQWPMMGAEAYRRLGAYRAEADRCARAFTTAGLPSPLEYLIDGPPRQWSQIDVQAALFTHAAGLARVWRSCGIRPDTVVGHSLGEVAAAYVAGSLRLADAVAVLGARAEVVERLAGPYGMAALGAGIAEAQRLIGETPGWLEVAVVNSDSSTVVSGQRAAVCGFVKRAEGCGLFVREIDVAFPAHTSALQPLRGTLEALLPVSTFADTPVEVIGSARGGVVAPGTDFTGYWYDNLRNTVRFDRAVAAAARRGVGAFIEMSAHPSLVYALTDQLHGALVVGSGRRDEPLAEHLSANIAAAAVADPGHRWADVVGVVPGPTLPGFPNAPMRPVHLWAMTGPLRDDRERPAITVAVEQWQPHRVTVSGRRNDIAGVALVAPEPGPLVRQLTLAIGSRRDCRLVAPDDAEITLYVPPGAAEPAPRLDYPTSVGPRCRRVWLITLGAERVLPGERLGPQAALAAAHRSVGFELPDCAFAHLDLPNRDFGADDASACIDALLDQGHTEVALRGGPAALRRYVRALREPTQLPPRRQLDALTDVVITGGNGGIGLRYARHCIRHGARRVVLLSRRGVGPHTVDELTAGRDVELHAPMCDITDPGAVAAAVAASGGGGASLLIHAAGVATFAAHHRLTGAEMDAMWGAKVHGLQRMIEAWPLRRDAHLLLCSSVSGVWGGHGHAGYAAANRALDVLAGQLRAEGRDCTAVRWGLWPATTIAAADEIARMERSGLVELDPEAAITASLCHHADDPLIFAADSHRLRMFFAGQGAPAADAEGLVDATVGEMVRAELTAALRLSDPQALDMSAALIDLGVDSLLALDLRRRLRRGVGRSIPLARLLGGITGLELIDALRPETPAAAPWERQGCTRD